MTAVSAEDSVRDGGFPTIVGVREEAIIRVDERVNKTWFSSNVVFRLLYTCKEFTLNSKLT